MALLRTLIADDHPVFLEGLRTVLSQRCAVLEAATNGVDLIEAERRLRPELILSDISMPGLNGIEAVRALRGQGSRARILMLSMHEDRDFALEALHAGADGYLLKSSVLDEIQSALNSMLAGRLYVTPQIAHGEFYEFEKARRDPTWEAAGLSVREREVLQLIAEGNSIKEIAAILNVAARTVFFHKSNVKRKLGLAATADLTRYAVRMRIVNQ